MSIEKNVPSEQEPRVDFEAYKRAAHAHNKAIRRQEIASAIPKVALRIVIGIVLVAAVVYTTIQLLASREALSSATHYPALLVIALVITGAIIIVVSIVVVLGGPIVVFKALRGAVDDMTWTIGASVATFIVGAVVAIVINALYFALIFYK
jgi:hypothetical protein